MFQSLSFSFRLRRVILKSLRLELLVFSLLLSALSAQSKARVDQPLAQEPATDAQTVQEVTTLEPGKAIERDLSSGQKHTYQLRLTEGQYAELTVLERGILERGIKVVITVIAPNGKPVMKLDNPENAAESQAFNLIAETSGNYLLIVQPSGENTPTGRYAIQVKELRTATEADRNFAEAVRLSREARNLRVAGKYDEALATAEKALLILEKIHGVGDAETADIINEKGLIYNTKGDYKKAEQAYLRALEIYEKTLGSEHPYVATALSNLGLIYRAMSDFEKAEAVYQRALMIYEKKYSSEHLRVATLLNNLAFLYYSKGEYTKAEQPYQRALSIREKQFGADSLEVAAIINNLALLYRVKGDYPKALLFLQRTVTIFEKNLPAEHPNIPVVLANLAAIVSEMGDYEKAEQLFRRVLTISEKTNGAEHFEVATILNNFGQLYDRMGDYEKAEPLFQRALAIQEKVYGADHPLVAAMLGSLAAVYRAKGDYAKAEPLFQRALEITEKKLGKEHTSVAITLNNQALLYFNKGEYAKAEPLFHRSLEIFEKANGRDHPFTARPLGNLASLYAAKGDFAQALLFQQRYLAVREQNLELNLYTGSERQKLAYVETLSRDMVSTIALHTQSMPQSDEAKGMALQLILSRKGRTLDAMAGTVASLRRRALPEDQNLIDQLSDVRTRLATLTLRGAGNDNPEQYQQRLKALEEKRERLEDDVSRRSLEFRAQSQAVTIEAVRAMIPENAALVEFIVYRPVNLQAAPNEQSLSEPCYVAYVARKQGEVQWVKLGEAQTIDAAIDKLRQAFRDPKRKDTQQLARLADEKIMQPVRALLGEATHLLISPDGALNFIALEALLDQQGKYLLQRYAFTYLTSGRDLLRMQVARDSKSAPLVVADPLFGEPVLTPVAKAEAPKVKPATLTRKRRSVTSGAELSSVYFAPLGGTAGEAQVIKSLFADTNVLTGRQATESAIKQVNVPRILHIATHGFFLQAAAPAETSTEKKRSISASARIDNPLLRSGLALAGANLRGESGDDGILTALEASGLNLWGTKLVTLSACDTGIGEVKTGEGVYGLRRAFVLAGAESLVMSLWPVSDAVTREMMSAYYKGLRQGQGRGAALRQVQLGMLKRKERQHPFYWASFIQSGEWANLDGKR